eukprot:10409085-Alexandrium_andersonii.AAC.1
MGAIQGAEPALSHPGKSGAPASAARRERSRRPGRQPRRLGTGALLEPQWHSSGGATMTTARGQQRFRPL